MAVDRTPRSPSHTSNTAPQVIAESATLNAGQCQPQAWKSRKSTTAPIITRSMTLPTAPPSTRLSARQPDDPQRCDDGNGSEQFALPAAGAGEKTEGRTAVVDQHQIEKRRHFDRRLAGERGHRDELAGLVQRDDTAGEQQPAPHQA